MQEQITNIIDTINSYIKAKNLQNAISTPFCHSAIRIRLGNKRRHYYKDIWEGLWDGLLATQVTQQKWADSISRAINHNRGQYKRKTPDSTSHMHSEEEHSPKRAWRRERTNFSLA